MSKIIIGLLCVMAANILFGATISKFKEEFSYQVLLRGIFKALCIVLGVFLMYLCGVLNPKIIVCKIGTVNMTLIEALEFLFLTGIVVYGFKDLVKLSDLLRIYVNIENKDPDAEKYVQVPIENNIRGDSDEIQ